MVGVESWIAVIQGPSPGTQSPEHFVSEQEQRPLGPPLPFFMIPPAHRSLEGLDFLCTASVDRLRNR